MKSQVNSAPRIDQNQSKDNCDLIIVSTISVTIEAFLASGMLLANRMGQNVCGVCSGDDSACILRLRDKGVTIHAVPLSRALSPLADIQALWSIWRLLNKLHPRCVHTHTPKAAFIGQLAAFLAGVPLRINTVHGLYFVNQVGMRRKIFRTLELLACRMAHRIICVSQEDVSYLTEECGLPASRITTRPVGVDLQRFQTHPDSALVAMELRRKLDMPEKAVVVGIVARMVREKGFCELLDAVKLLRERGHNAYLLHVGELDNSRGDGLSLDSIETTGIAPFCRFVGSQQDVPRWLATMDIYCLPSYREGFPVSVMEAMAMELPCVVTNIRGCREAVRADIDGILVPPRDAQALADALEKLICSPELRKRMGAAAAERARTSFDRVKLDTATLDEYGFD